MRKKVLTVLSVIVIVLAALFVAVWRIPLPAGEWGEQQMSAGYTGVFEKNGKLDDISFISLGGYTHPETVLVRDGWIYASVKGGVLIKLREDGTQVTKLLDTGGCLLGFDFDNDGSIIALDCDYNGTGALIKVAPDGSGDAEILVNKESGCELFYPNALAISSDSVVYFTDSTTAFAPKDYADSSSAAAANEALMHTRTGRLFSYDMKNGDIKTVATGGAFSNGVGLSDDEKTLFVCETYAYAVRSVNLETGEVSKFLENLPGFPDNLTKGEDGRYWVGLNGERSDSLDAIADKPLLRKAVWLYGKLFPAQENPNAGYCHVFAFDQEGNVTNSLQSGNNAYYRSTGCAEAYNRLYIQSINETGKLGYIKKPEITP